MKVESHFFYTLLRMEVALQIQQTMKLTKSFMNGSESCFEIVEVQSQLVDTQLKSIPLVSVIVPSGELNRTELMIVESRVGFSALDCFDFQTALII